jgi:predicted nucleic acid-binding protein
MAAGGPALIATDLCADLACGHRAAVDFFRDPPVAIRLSTVTYLHLLARARSPAEQRRIKRFVAPYPVLSLGPMASAKAVELVLEAGLTADLGPLAALVAATALAHELPVYTRDPVFRSVPGLEVVTPY